MRNIQIVLAIGFLASCSVSAQQIDRLQLLGQTQFRLLSEDLGGALSYRPQTPTEPLGITGFDLGVGYTAAKIENTAILQRASSNSVSSTVSVPTLRAHKGLPWGLDIGASYAAIPNSNMKYYGGELRYALVEGGLVKPAVGLRGSFTRLTGVNQLDLDTRSVDLSISKGFAFVTPYAGIGRVWVDSTPIGVPLLRAEEFSLNKIFVGFGIKLLAFNINIEGDRTGGVTAYSLKLGIRF